MPKHVSNTKGSLMLGYLKDGSDDEHLGELVHLYYTCEFFSHSLFIVLSKNIPWLKVLILRMVPSPSSEVDPGKQYIVVRKSPRHFIVRWIPETHY